MKESVKGWFKLLSQEEGEFYNVRIVDGDEEMDELTEKLEVRVGRGGVPGSSWSLDN